MKKLVFALTLAFSSLAIGAQEKITVSVNGMVCDFCAQGVKKQFGKLDNVKKVDVDFEGPKNAKGESEKLVILQMKDDTSLSDKIITEKIEDAGFKVIEIRRAEMK